MPSKLTERIRTLLTFANEEGADDAAITVEGRHLKLTVRVGDRVAKRGIGKTPSDWRADRNNRAWIRRTIREFRA